MSRVRPLLPWVLVLLLLGWWSQGVWPVVPVEGDEQGVIFGVEGMLREDPVLLHVRYLYQVQPGSYHLLVTLVAADGLLGLRTLSDGQRLFTTAPTCVQLFATSLGAKSVAVVVGPGELVANADGFRLRTGQAFAPRCWQREKKRLRLELATIRTWLEREADLTLLWSNWLPYQMISRELFAAGFRPVEPPRSDTGISYQGAWRRGDRHVRVAYLGYVRNNQQKPGIVPVIPPDTLTYFVGDCAFQPITALPDARRWHLLSAVPQGFLTLFQRR